MKIVPAFIEIGTCEECNHRCEFFAFVEKQGLAYCVNRECSRRYLLTVRLHVPAEQAEKTDI